MENAFSLKGLGQKLVDELKAQGLLKETEENVEKIGKCGWIATKAWLKESAKMSENKVDDFAVVFVDQLDPIVLPQIEKLDLNKDGK